MHISHLHTMFTDSEDTLTAEEGEDETSGTLEQLTTKFLYKEAVSASAVTLTDEQVKAVEERTREQAQNPEWKTQRKGRITASYFGRVCKVTKKYNFLVVL